MKNRAPESKEFPAKRRLEAKKPELDCRALSVKVLACPRDIVGSVPDYHNKVSIVVKQVVIVFAVGGYCLQFVKNAPSVMHKKARCSSTRYACNWPD